MSEIQNKIILPAYLPEKQRAIVFDPTKRMYLEQNPIDIEVEGLEHRFKTLDKTKDIPNSRGILWKAIEAMKSKEDWENLGTILAGFRKAGVALSPNQLGKIIRLAYQAGQIGTIIECAKQAQHTGLYIVNKEQIAHVYLAINKEIAAANGDLAQIKQAVSQAETVLDLVQRPEHLKKIAAANGHSTLLQFSSVTRGMILHARASLVEAKQLAEEPVDENLITLKDDLALLKSLWAAHLQHGIPLVKVRELTELNPRYEEQATKELGAPKLKRLALGDRESRYHFLNGSSYVRSLAWTVRGIQLAEQIAKEETAPLLPLAKSLETHVASFLTLGSENGESWAKEYEEIVGHKPT